MDFSGTISGGTLPASGTLPADTESLSPPATQNFDLTPTPAVPALSVPAIALLCGVMLCLVARAGVRRDQAA